jgi:hypothetical protein
LINRCHHRGIEKRGRLDRVLHREAGADEPLSPITDFTRTRNKMLDQFKVVEEDVVDIRVQRSEVAFDAGQERLDLGLRNC